MVVATSVGASRLKGDVFRIRDIENEPESVVGAECIGTIRRLVTPIYFVKSVIERIGKGT